jgi:hypothetical protein
MTSMWGSDNGNGHAWGRPRRHPRVHLGLPVRVHMAGDPAPVNMELVDVSLEGALFHTTQSQPYLGQKVGFGFVLPDHSICTARGNIVRVDDEGFALELDDTNPEFVAFIEDISGPYFFAA